MSYFNVPAYAFVPMLYAESLEQTVSYIEAFMVLGLSAGMFIGGEFFYLGGLALPFYVISGMIFLLLLGVIKYVPS